MLHLIIPTVGMQGAEQVETVSMLWVHMFLTAPANISRAGCVFICVWVCVCECVASHSIQSSKQVETEWERVKLTLSQTPFTCSSSRMLTFQVMSWPLVVTHDTARRIRPKLLWRKEAARWRERPATDTCHAAAWAAAATRTKMNLTKKHPHQTQIL